MRFAPAAASRDVLVDKERHLLDGRGGLLRRYRLLLMAVGPAGTGRLRRCSRWPGHGMVGGFGKLAEFGFGQPVIAVCGDSTFYHATIPAVISGIYNRANFTLLVLDNSATAMTGFQPHPGTGRSATGEQAPVVDIPTLCRALGVRVEETDPFDLAGTQEKLLDLMRDDAVCGDGRRDARWCGATRETCLQDAHRRRARSAKAAAAARAAAFSSVRR
jgi:TPP-dependent indolepyruvate ferredoxin oxidoreductase alpha subunit